MNITNSQYALRRLASEITGETVCADETIEAYRSARSVGIVPAGVEEQMLDAIVAIGGRLLIAPARVRTAN